MGRPTVIAGNWKMYKTRPEAKEFIEALAADVADSEFEVRLAVPFTAISDAVQAAEGSRIQIGAQNMHDVSAGAFTGEVAAPMLKDVGAQFVLLGHSERRHVFGESDESIHRKVVKAIEEDIPLILCVGETLDEREAGKTEEVLATQLKEALKGVDPAAHETMCVAYEPVWAIGTGKTATPEVAQEAHAHCRKLLVEVLSVTAAEKTPILYGGSVKPGNVADLIAQDDIDGALVGGASLDVESFVKIVNYQSQKLGV